MEVKNYNQPVDASLFPEGCPRCSLLKFLLHLVPVAAVGLWGAYAAFRVLAHGLGETGLDDYFGFGLWITFDLAVIALGAGAFFTGALRYLLNIDALKNIINLTVVVGFLCYSGAMLVLVLDIGQPLRAWFGYWHPNVHSMLTEVIFCITCYCTVLIIEYVPLALENRQLAKNKLAHAIAHNFHLIMPLFAGIGASCIMQGIKRGLYSNEAGMGSAPNAAAAADVSHPVKQGLVQMLSVFIDTILICSTTAFMLLLSGVPIDAYSEGMNFVQAAVHSQVGPFGPLFITVSIFLFAFSSLVGNYYYTESNFRFIRDSKTGLLVFRLTCVAAIFIGAQMSFSMVWDLADVLMGLMALVNLVAILLLGGKAIRVLKDYQKQRRAGKNPVYRYDEVGVGSPEIWNEAHAKKWED